MNASFPTYARMGFKGRGVRRVGIGPRIALRWFEGCLTTLKGPAEIYPLLWSPAVGSQWLVVKVKSQKEYLSLAGAIALSVQFRVLTLREVF